MATILMAYTNPLGDGHLPELEKEEESIFNILLPGMNRGFYSIININKATPSKLINQIQSQQEEIIVFHYGGHADRDTIHLHDGEAHHVGLISALMGCLNLKLVVLNGCATLNQCVEIQEAFRREKRDVIVIGTQAKVRDSSATNFAIEFYKKLATDNQTVEAAFGDGVTKAMPHYAAASGKPLAPLVRAVMTRKEAVGAVDTWTLLGNGEAYRLPRKNRFAIDQQYEINKHLIDTLYADEENIKGKKLDAARQEDNRDDLEVKRGIENAFPAPIAHNISRLFDTLEGGFGKQDLRRLRQIYKTYASVMDLILTGLMSQLYAVARRETVTLDADTKSAINDYLLAGGDNVNYFGYHQIARVMTKYLCGRDKLHPFAIDVIDFFENADDTFKVACSYLEGIYGKIPEEGGVNPEDLMASSKSRMCRRAEESLTTVLQRLGFLCKYNICATYEVEYQEFRYRGEKIFLHDMLAFNHLGKGISTSNNPTENYLVSRSVSIFSGTSFKELKSPQDYLVLTPFMVDKFAYTKPRGFIEKPTIDLYYLRAVNTEDKKVEYQSIKDFIARNWDDVPFPDSLENSKDIGKPSFDVLGEQIRHFLEVAKIIAL